MNSRTLALLLAYQLTKLDLPKLLAVGAVLGLVLAIVRSLKGMD